MAENITRTESSTAIKVIKYWIPVFLMMILIYYFSTGTFSSDNTGGIVEPFFSWLLPGLSEQTFHAIHYFVRKLSHFLEYAILAALLFRALRADAAVRWRLKWALYSFVVLAGLALLDEYHQSFSPMRDGRIHDSLLDCAGGLSALVIIAWLNRSKNHQGPL